MTYECMYGCGQIITNGYYEYVIEVDKHPPLCSCKWNDGHIHINGSHWFKLTEKGFKFNDSYHDKIKEGN